jgi:4-amino-4-deoxy-L-arabinose transferase-like glycosyltransferase
MAAGTEEGAVEQAAIPPAGSERPGRFRRWGWLEPVALFVLALVLNLAGNGRTGLWDRDEPRYAVCVREMRERGDWIFPTFNGEPRYHKPILIYWLMRAGTALGGDNPFGARLVSALAGAATVLGAWGIGRRMLGVGGARLAGLILATAPIVVAESKLATTDATLAFFVLGCQFCLWELARRPSRWLAALFWICLSLATLTKGPIGPALIAASALLSWFWAGPTACWKRLHWKPGLVGFFLLTVPWYVAISIASRGEFLRFAVGKEIVHRALSDMEAHGGFPGYYPIVSTLAFYPWSALVPAALAGAWLRRKSDSALGFLMGWAIGPLLLLECLGTKLIHYYLPAFPALAILLAWLIRTTATEGVNVRRWPLGRLGLALLAGIGMAGTVLMITGGAMLRGPLAPPMLLVALLIAAGTLAGVSLFQQGATERAAYSLATTWAIVMLVCGGWLLPVAEPYRTARVIGERLARRSTELGIEPVLLEYQEPGVIYAMGRPIPTTRDRDGFFAHLRGGRSVLTVALPSEIDVMRKHFGLVVNLVDQVEGFVLTKGKKQTLQVAVVREGDQPVEPVPLAPHMRRVGLKETLVK